MTNSDISKPGERGYPFHAFEPMITQKVLKLLNPNDIVIDVGSWTGYYVLLYEKKVSKVIAMNLPLMTSGDSGKI